MINWEKKNKSSYESVRKKLNKPIKKCTEHEIIINDEVWMINKHLTLLIIKEMLW